MSEPKSINPPDDWKPPIERIADALEDLVVVQKAMAGLAGENYKLTAEMNSAIIREIKDEEGEAK